MTTLIKTYDTNKITFASLLEDSMFVFLFGSNQNINEEYLEDKFEIEVLNLDKIENKYYNKNIKLKRLLKFLKAKTREEAIKISKGDEKLMQMMSTMEMYVNDERTKSYHLNQANRVSG